MIDSGSGERLRVAWWLGGMVAAAGLLMWLIWGGEEERMVEEPPREQPQMETAPDEEELGPADGPFDRPPGTAPADPRRPATVPHDQPGDGSRSESQPIDRDDEGGADEARLAAPSNSSHRQARSVPSGFQGDGDVQDEASPEEADQSEDSDASSSTDEARRAAVVSGQGEDEAWVDEEAELAEGEWDEETEQWLDEEQVLDEEEWDGEEVGRYEDGEWIVDEDDELEEEVADEIALEAEEWAEEPPVMQDEPYDDEAMDAQDSGRSQPPRAGADGTQGSSSGTSPDRDDAEFDDDGAQGTGAGDAPPSQEALDGYQDELDRAGTPGPQEAAMYSAVATSGLADALYMLSAGRTLSDAEASRQRDDLIEGADDGYIDGGGDDLGDDEALSDDDVGGDGDEEEAEFEERFDEEFDEESMPDRDIDDENFDQEWTVWLDAADWLRYVQEEEYPQLAELIDAVDEAAAAIDPETPRSEQVDELMDFFEAVEVVLEAMAAEDGANVEVGI